jgi:hypothetical protein
MVTETNLISTSMVSSTSSTTTIPTSFSIPVAEKLSRTNYMLWRTQVMPAIHAAHLDNILLSIEKMSAKTISNKVGDATMEKPNLDYFNWVTRDQVLLGYLFSSLTCEVLQGVTMLTSSAEV